MNKHLGSEFDEFLKAEGIEVMPDLCRIDGRDPIAEVTAIQERYVSERKILRLQQKIAVLIQEIHGLRIEIDHLKGEQI